MNLSEQEMTLPMLIAAYRILGRHDDFHLGPINGVLALMRAALVAEMMRGDPEATSKQCIDLLNGVRK